MAVEVASTSRGSSRPRVAAAVVATILAFGGALVGAEPATAATCSSLSKSGSYISGTCYGSSFTIWWDCWWSPTVNKATIRPGWTNGMSFRIYACDTAVNHYGVM